MQHLLIERVTFGGVTTSFSHSPEDQDQSMLDYFEDKLETGYELVSATWYSTSFLYCVFKVVGK